MKAVVEVTAKGKKYNFSTADDHYVSIKDGTVFVWKGDPNDPLEVTTLHRAFGPGFWEEVKARQV